MNHSLDQVKQLRERLDVFLSKLWEQAEELISQAKTVAPEPDDNNADPDEFQRSFLAFETALRKQMREIVQRGEKIFQERFEVFVDTPDPEIRALYLAAEAAVRQLEEDIEQATEEVFEPVTNSAAERRFKRSITEWEEAAAEFRCKQCGTLIPVPELYFQAQYLPCPKCGTQATFTPTPAMQQAPQWAEASEAITTARATARFVRVTPMKARRVVDLVRGKSVSEALAILKYAPQAASEPVAKVVASAAANAENNFGLDRDSLVISQAWADEGPTMRRFRPRAQGRAFHVRKRTSHITVVVESQKGSAQ